uniref:Uncharacterized protein n=1 Tax=Anguilla anguilla TaxID=7936 RepID=A0A0E9QW32_ANGAN
MLANPCKQLDGGGGSSCSLLPKSSLTYANQKIHQD